MPSTRFLTPAAYISLLAATTKESRSIRSLGDAVSLPGSTRSVQPVPHLPLQPGDPARRVKRSTARLQPRFNACGRAMSCCSAQAALRGISLTTTASGDFDSPPSSQLTSPVRMSRLRRQVPRSTDSPAREPTSSSLAGSYVVASDPRRAPSPDRPPKRPPG